MNAETSPARGSVLSGQSLRRIESTFVVLETDNIDTDQICPARFLTSTAREGFKKALFADWRYDKSGAARPEFPMNRPEASGAGVLVTGRNFGCGSSREHAVWALRENGIQAVIATAVADIFKRNALKNGVVPVVIEPASHAALVAARSTKVIVDVEALVVRWEGGEAKFEMESFARHCLMDGVDELGYLLKQDAAIAAFESNRPTW